MTTSPRLLLIVQTVAFGAIVLAAAALGVLPVPPGGGYGPSSPRG
jgi:hypothetical protein